MYAISAMNNDFQFEILKTYAMNIFLEENNIHTFECTLAYTFGALWMKTLLFKENQVFNQSRTSTLKASQVDMQKEDMLCYREIL